MRTHRLHPTLDPALLRCRLCKVVLANVGELGAVDARGAVGLPRDRVSLFVQLREPLDRRCRPGRRAYARVLWNAVLVARVEVDVDIAVAVCVGVLDSILVELTARGLQGYTVSWTVVTAPYNVRALESARTACWARR